MDDDETKLLPHTTEDIYGALLFPVLEVTELPKELQIMIAGYVDFTTADCYAGFHAFATKIRAMMCTSHFYIVVKACEYHGDTYTLHVPLTLVLKTQDVPLSKQELSELFLRSKKSFHMVQLDQILSDETRAHILTTVLPFVQQRTSLRFPHGLTTKAYIQDSTRTLTTHRNFNCLRQVLWPLLWFASSGVIAFFVGIWIGPYGSLAVIPFMLCSALLYVNVRKCCESRRRARADTTIKQTWVWGLEENEDFRETLKDVVALARIAKS